MAVLFDDANTQYLEATSAAHSVAVFTLSCSMNVDDVDAGGVCFGLMDSSSTGGRAWIDPLGASDTIRFVVEKFGSSSGFATTVNAFTVNTWHHICGIERSDTDRVCILDGDFGNEGNNTDDLDWDATPDRTTIGRLGDSTPSNYFSGSLAECAIWSVALTDAEVSILANGYSALFVRPQSLVFYDSMIRPDSGDDTHDRIGGLTMVGAGGTGTPVATPHPRIIFPSTALIAHVVAAAAGANPKGPLGLPLYGPLRGPI